MSKRCARTSLSPGRKSYVQTTTKLPRESIATAGCDSRSWVMVTEIWLPTFLPEASKTWARMSSAEVPFCSTHATTERPEEEEATAGECWTRDNVELTRNSPP